MKKFIFITIILFLFVSLCFSIPKPKQNVGALIGKTYIELDKDWDTMRAGKYYKVTVIMYSKSTKKKYSARADKDGFFYFLNLKPDEYLLAYSKYEYRLGDITYTCSGSFGEKGITVKVDSNKITAVRTLISKNEILPFNERTDAVTNLHKRQKINQTCVREDNLEELKAFFNNIDKKNDWKDFEWQVQ